MIYLYDKAISDDLRQSFNPHNVPNPVVKVVDPDQYLTIGSQVQNDQLSFPLVGLTRNGEVKIDSERLNFTRLHTGVAAVFDSKTNQWYNEKVLPISLSYELHVVATNTADMDEIIREILFKYASMYFLTIRLPYESNRKIRFGVVVDNDAGIEPISSYNDYSETGRLYESKLILNCQGCVLVNYTPVKLRRLETEVDVNG